MTRPWKFKPGNITPDDMVGRLFGVWRVVSSLPSMGSGARWLCRCERCGATRDGRTSDVKRWAKCRCARQEATSV